MEDKEKAIEQLSGRVTETQKAYFNEMEGSFADKVAELIESHKVRVKDNAFNVEANKSAIHQALNVIVKNMETIELNAKNYVQDIKSDIEVRVNALEEDCTELNNVKEENQRLKENNQDISAKIEALANEYRDLIDKSTSDQANAAVKYDKLKKEYEELNQSHMKLRIEFGDMKDDLTRKNISLTEILNKLNEDHNQEVSQLKEDHAAELAKLNKEANELINGVSRDYTELKIKTDATISKLDKELAVAKSELTSKDNIIEQLEKDAAWLKPFASVNIQYQNRIYQLEKLLKDNGIEFNTSDQK